MDERENFSPGEPTRVTADNLEDVACVSSTGVENTEGTQCSVLITALCGNSSIWVKRGIDAKEWTCVNGGRLNEYHRV